MKELKQELFETLANELNNNREWEFDNRKVVSAATNEKGGLALVLTDGVAIEQYTINIRRSHVTRRKGKGKGQRHSRR